MSVPAPQSVVCIGKTDQLSGFNIPAVDFMMLGNKIFNEISITEYRQIALLFSNQPWEFGSLYAFQLIEELETAMPLITQLTPREADQLTLIYNNAKYQAYDVTEISKAFV